MKTTENASVKDAAVYFFTLLVVLVLLNLLMGGIHRPVLQYFRGEAVDFGTYWQEARLSTRLLLAFIIALLFALNRYRKAKKGLAKDQNTGTKPAD
ncbi:hypothetical protein [Cesiribacter andamanensis]|uniref:Uncharacterized protein n=1 Tax=Cesiribacter andamanensis AMV16 TaxID=1279009 RepID=M7N6P8_9BACT|nr:hypothetical protein [Cesiribacter andamanensis]EMR02906.1 hypothetical protein ADICEAN_01944 [Cesiribacter andamanensis AMV16]